MHENCPFDWFDYDCRESEIVGLRIIDLMKSVQAKERAEINTAFSLPPSRMYPFGLCEAPGPARMHVRDKAEAPEAACFWSCRTEKQRETGGEASCARLACSPNCLLAYPSDHVPSETMKWKASG